MKKMTDKNKNLGIWMDHSIANLMEPNDSIIGQIIESDFKHENKVDSLHRSENLMHNKEQQLHESYYNTIATEILKYDRVLLFGPTNAKSELHKYMNKDLHFKDIKIEIETADKMTDNVQLEFVRSHFENH